MTDLKELHKQAKSISILREVITDKGVSALIEMCADTTLERFVELYAEYFAALAREDCTEDSIRYIQALIQKSENVFAKRSAAKQAISKNVIDAVERELITLYNLGSLTPADLTAKLSGLPQLPQFEKGKLPQFNVERLIKFHKENGYGVYTKAIAFSWDEKQKKLIPLYRVNPIKLENLKEYVEEKQVILDNTESFVMGLPANNVLLYGDRGTGKSSTVHAMLNKFSDRGLRLVELQKSGIGDLKMITAELNNLTNRFIIFIDDLTFTSDADNYAELKAALEGSVAKSDNTLIYATTNRRHLMKESHNERGDDVSGGDTIQEQLSLSDRFGLVVTFINPDRREFINILEQILFERKITLDKDELSLIAERYALRKGGRSPRAARQLADMIESKVRRNLPLDL